MGSKSSELRPAWDTGLSKERKQFFKSLIPFFIVVTIVLWICLPIFWGSTLLLEHYFYKLNIQVVDFDSAASGADAVVGPPLLQQLLQINQQSGPHLTYYNTSPSNFPNGPQDVMQSVGHNEAWGAIVIFANATTAWRNAIETGNSSYDPTGSVGIYYSGAHFYQIVLLYVVPLLTQNVQSALATISDMTSRNFLQNAIAVGNTTAITTAAAAPQSLGNVFGFFQYDVRPITAWASAGPMEAGLIYNVIFTFHLVLFSFIARMKSGLQMKLTTASLLKIRLGVPAFCYFWFSLSYALVCRAFQIPFENSIGSAGFVVFWAMNYITFLAIGLALEAFMSLLTPRWFPFSLIFWIIINITSSFLPIVLMQPFYRWGRVFPFRLNVEATKIIFYDTQPPHILGQYIGGLMAWAFAGIVAVILTQLLDRWRMEKGQRQEKENKASQADENAKNSPRAESDHSDHTISSND